MVQFVNIFCSLASFEFFQPQNPFLDHATLFDFDDLRRSRGIFSKNIFFESERSNEKDEVRRSFLVEIFTKLCARCMIFVWKKKKIFLCYVGAEVVLIDFFSKWHFILSVPISQKYILEGE